MMLHEHSSLVAEEIDGGFKLLLEISGCCLKKTKYEVCGLLGCFCPLGTT